MESCGGGVREKENGTAGELLLNTMEGAIHWEEQSAARLPVQEGARLGAAETSREGQALLAEESFKGGLSPRIARSPEGKVALLLSEAGPELPLSEAEPKRVPRLAAGKPLEEDLALLAERSLGDGLPSRTTRASRGGGLSSMIARVPRGTGALPLGGAGQEL
jgi:hypothetical protein